MSKVYLANAFSLGMLKSSSVILRVNEIDLKTAIDLLKSGFESCIGHQATAEFLTKLLQLSVKAERKAIQLEPGDLIIVFQLLQRLPEGAILDEEKLKKIPYKIYQVNVM